MFNTLNVYKHIRRDTSKFFFSQKAIPLRELKNLPRLAAAGPKGIGLELLKFNKYRNIFVLFGN
jgi:hypothetical protein